MRLMSNEVLVHCYFKAMDLKLEAEFINLLRDEIQNRKINLDYYSNGEAQVS
ncbi:developmental checkpoint coupling sporulation initiation to replication initiation [Paenibacillus sp. 1_12]|uniref:sporulation histidine kinase inhibitor Sda n=1 Tax=Paenibacillus sp. 1_12 TaxID=1566278 RepID=UPI0008EA5881|nr:sporulation histidine kinase inhibitor Sda [Paenibacillus sp. 1_12]SFK76769.1 developmental checkpoint coupling sporulation initiation to replication initiation [Paenibacillus sp. 1_12]